MAALSRAVLATGNLLLCCSQQLCAWCAASCGAMMATPFQDAFASRMPNGSRVVILAAFRTGKPSYPSGSRICLFFKVDSSSSEPCRVSVIQSDSGEGGGCSSWLVPSWLETCQWCHLNCEQEHMIQGKCQTALL